MTVRSSSGFSNALVVNSLTITGLTTPFIPYVGAGGTLADSPLARADANTLEQRNSTTAQTFRVYNTYTDASNNERGFVGWSANAFRVGTEANGSGTNRDLQFIRGGTAQVRVGNALFAPLTDTTVSLGLNTMRWSNTFTQQLTLIDGVTAPSAITGHAVLYVDTADGDLKIIFSDGTIKTIITDT